MKTNPITKTVGKWKLLTILVSALIVVGIVIAAIFGFNTTADFKSVKTLKVEYSYGTKADDLQAVCTQSFAESGVSPIQVKVTTSVPGEIIYYFDLNTDLTAAETALEADIAAEMVVDGKLENASFIDVYTNVEEFKSGLAEGFVLRAAIAVAVFAVLAFAYVALRYKLSMGITMAATILATAGLTVALTACTRIPVTPSFAYAALVAVLTAVVMTLLTFHRFRDAAKDKDKQKGMSSQEKVIEAVDSKATIVFVVAMAVATVILGAFVATARWFAVSMLFGLVAAFVSSWLFAPALLAVLDGAIKRGDKPLFRAKKKKEEVAEAVEEKADEAAEEVEE